MKLQVDSVIIVEGKYDKIKLDSLLDALVITTDGFAVFHDPARVQNLRTLAARRGAIILTDSDRAGFQIRRCLHGILHGCALMDIYIPDVYGKEKRKENTSAEGKLGVEGMSADVLIRLFSGLGAAPDVPRTEIQTSDLYAAGLYGGQNSAAARRAFLHRLGLPARINKNTLLKVLNAQYTADEFQKLLHEETVR